MKFQELFEKENENCLFVGEGFVDGFCIFVDDFGCLKNKHYQNENDIHPIIENQLMYKGLLKKDYKKVLLVKHLFKN